MNLDGKSCPCGACDALQEAIAAASGVAIADALAQVIDAHNCDAMPAPVTVAAGAVAKAMLTAFGPWCRQCFDVRVGPERAKWATPVCETCAPRPTRGG